MSQDEDSTTCWTTWITALSVELGWGLSKEEVERFAPALRSLLPVDVAYVTFRKVCIDYWTVQALLDHGHPAHDDQWRYWMQRALEVLRKWRMGWSSDAAVDVDDLNQKAQMAFLESLKTFNYKSSLDTWLHSVVVRSVNRHVRDSLAKKRAQRPDCLDDLSEAEQQDGESDTCFESVQQQIVIDQTRQILFESGGERLVLIFFLYTFDRYSAKEIAAMVGLHDSRVRALLRSARNLLRAHPRMQAWR